MTYKTGSITSATPAKALLDLLDPDLVAVGYVRVETGLVVGAVTWNVYRSPGTANFFGSDWYFALGYDTTGQTTLYSCVMEDWDTTSDLASRYAPSTTNLVPGVGYINPQAASALPAGFTLSHALPTTAFTYAYSALIDRVAMAAWTAAATSRFGWYIGLYDSFYSTTDDPFPLAITNIGVDRSNSGGSTTVGSSTREPMTTSANSTNFFVSPGTSSLSWTWTNINNQYQGGRPWVGRALLAGRGGPLDTNGFHNFPRGLLRDMFATSVLLTTNGNRITWTAAGQNYAGVIFRSTSSPLPILIPEY